MKYQAEFPEYIRITESRNFLFVLGKNNSSVRGVSGTKFFRL
jgi:hypothetical protein